MTNTKVVKLMAFGLLFVLINVATSSIATADEKHLVEGRTPVNLVYEIIPDISLGNVINDEAAPTPAVPEDTSEEIFSLSSTASVTVTLGAWRNLRPTESYLRDVSMLSPDFEVDCVSKDQKSKGWIVGYQGTILSYCNGVWDHAIVVESLPTDINGVQAITPELSVAVGAQGAVLMYLYDPIADDWVWTKSPIPVGNQTLFGISIVSAIDGGYTGWTVGTQDSNGRGTLVRGTITPIPGSVPLTYSYTWENLTANYPDLPDAEYYYGIQMLSPKDGWITGGTTDNKGIILHWDGKEWSLFQMIEGHPVLGIYMRSENDGWAVSKNGGILHYDGNQWREVESPTTSYLVEVSFNSNDEGWAVGSDGTIIKYSGNSWELFKDLRTDAFDFRALDFESGDGWMVGYHGKKSIGGQILEFDRGLWLSVTPPTDNRINDVSILSANDAWAVGNADSFGGTIIHWDGEHWQRWYQEDIPIPAVDLQAIAMVSENEGWAAGNPTTVGAPAVFLRWDGQRWSPPRYDSPINVRVNALALLEKKLDVKFGGWAVASEGNAVAKWDGQSDYWSANHTCYGIFYNLRNATIISGTNVLGWDAWAVGKSLNPATGEYFLRYLDGCSGGYAWQGTQQPVACEPSNTDGPSRTNLYGVEIHPDTWGFAVGDYKERGSIYWHNGVGWTTDYCMADGDPNYPSRLYSTDIVDESGVAWFAGYYTVRGKKEAWLRYHDSTGYHFGGTPFPINGVNIYHRPVKRLRMLDDYMGWAVGDVEGLSDFSVLYQYPYPNFTFESDPEIQVVMPGETGIFSITVNSIGGFDADVSLSLEIMPETITGDVIPDTINAESTAIVDVNTTTSTPIGNYEIPLLGYAVFQSGDSDIPVWRYFNLGLIITNTPVYSVKPSSGPSGTEVVITGDNFGSDPGAGNRSTSSNHVILAGAQMPDSSVKSWTDNQIIIMVPDKADLFPNGPTYGEVSVIAGGNQSNTNHNFQLENFIENIETNYGDSEITITLTGTSFGNDPGGLWRSTSFEHVNFNNDWIPNEDVVSWGNNKIKFIVPDTTDSGLVSATSNGYQSNSVQFISNRPNIFLPLLQR